MGYLLSNSSTARPLVFLLIGSSDHITGLTGATATVTLSKNGSAFGSPSGAVSEIASGWYKVAGNATDTNTNGPLVLHATAASADPCDDRYEVVAFNPDDVVRLGLTSLPNVAQGTAGAILTSGTGVAQLSVTSGIASDNIVQIGGTAVTQAAGILSVNTTQIGGTAVTQTAGIMSVNATQFNGTAITATAGIPSVNATQFNGTAISATAGLANANITQVGGTAVTQSAGILSVNSTQIGSHAVILDGNNLLSVNVQDYGGTAGTFASGISSVNVIQYGGTAGTFSAGYPSVNLAKIGNTAVTSIAGIMSVNTTQWGGVNVTGMPMPTYTQPTGFLSCTFPTSGTVSTLGGTAQSGDAYAVVNNGTYGNSAIQILASSASSTSTGIYNIVNSGTYGNSALNTELVATYNAASAAATLAGTAAVNASAANVSAGSAATAANGASAAATTAGSNTSSLPNMIVSDQFTANALANAPVGGTTGSGQWAVTFTVIDSTTSNPILGALVSSIKANSTTAYGYTNSSGQVTLNINTGTYTYLCGTSGGAYYNYSSTGNNVTANTTFSISLIETPSIIPATLPYCQIYFSLYTSSGQPRPKTKVTFEVVSPPATPPGISYNSTDIVWSNPTTGVVQYTGIAGATYSISVAGGNTINVAIPANVTSYQVNTPPS